jgi:NAD-dependent dihydropyrimidine dehydrogenase PreA subunit
MPYKISDECTSCGSCVEACPAEAIKEGDGKFEIDPDVCIDCGVCVDTCPVEAIKEA